jgi:hypothetical protein
MTGQVQVSVSLPVIRKRTPWACSDVNNSEHRTLGFYQLSITEEKDPRRWFILRMKAQCAGHYRELSLKGTLFFRGMLLAQVIICDAETGLPGNVYMLDFLEQ